MRVEFLAKGLVQVSVLKHGGSWHCDVYVGEKRVLQNVGSDSVGSSAVVAAVYVNEAKSSHTPHIEFRGGIVVRPFVKRERKTRVRENNMPLSTVTFLSPYDEACGIATYTRFLMDGLKAHVGVDVVRDVHQVKMASLLHCQHEYGVFPNVNMVVGNPSVKDWPKVITWHTLAKNLDEGTSSGLTTREYVHVVDDVYDVHIVHSSLAKTWLMNEVSQPVYVIPHGTVCWRQTGKLCARRQLGLPLDAELVFAFGFIGELKGMLELARSVIKLREQYPRLLLVISGASHPKAADQCEAYRKKFEELGRSDAVVLLDKYLTEEQVNLYSDAADILAFNYQNRGEFASASGAAHRVIWSGKPLLCSNDPRMNEFQNGIHCLKFPIGDWEALEASLEALLTEHDLAEQLALNVKLLAKATSWECTALRHMQVYMSITEGSDRYGPDYYGEEYFVGSKGGLSYLTLDGEIKRWSYFNPDGEWKGAQPIMEAIKNVLNPGSMLDVGCGRGTFTAYAKKAGIDAVGVDFSPWAIEHPYPDAKWLVKVGDIRKLDFPDCSFDLVFCSDIMEHVYEEDLAKAVSEVQRVAKKWVFYNIGSTMSNDQEHFVLKKGEVPPVKWQGTCTAGHVNVRPCETYWKKRLVSMDWHLRDDLVEKFRMLVPKDVLANWHCVIITEKAE